MSLYSDMIQKPYVGLSKPSVPVLMFTAAVPELQVIATDATAAGNDAGSIRLRNARQIVGAGPTIYYEGTNASAAVKQLARIQATFDSSIVAGNESSKISFTVLAVGSNKSLQILGAASASFGPSAAAGFGLGSGTLPWNECWVGNGATRYVQITHTAPGGVSGIVFDVNGGELYVGGSRLLGLTATNVAVGPSIGYTALASLQVGGLSTGPDTYGVAAGPDGTGKTNVICYASAANLGAAGNRTALLDFYGLSVSSGATATNHYVFHTGSPTWVATNRYGFYGAFTAAANRYNLYCAGDAYNFMLGCTSIGNVPSVGSVQLDVATSAASLMVARFRNTNGTPTMDLVNIQGAGTSSGYHLLKVMDPTNAINRFAVRGDGTIFVNTSTVTENAGINIAQRIALAVNTTHDVGGGTTVAASLIVTSAYTVADTKQNDIIRISPSDIQLAGTGVANGITVNMTVSAASAGSFTRGLNGVIQAAGAGTTYVAFFRAIAQAGHTGTQYCMSVVTTAQPTTAASLGYHVAHTGRLNYGFIVQGSTPGDLLDYGLYVDASNSLSNSAVTYVQRAGSVGSLIEYIDSGGTTRFKVDYQGDVTFAGNNRRIKGLMNSGVWSANLSFQNAAANSDSYVQAMPSGTGLIGMYLAFGGSDADNALYGMLRVNGAAGGTVALNSGHTGTGVTGPLLLQIDSVSAIQIATNRDVMLAPAAAAVGMAAGFPYMAAVAGPPTGVPTARAGYVPFLYDSTNNFFYVYNAGWKKSTVYA